MASPTSLPMHSSAGTASACSASSMSRHRCSACKSSTTRSLSDHIDSAISPSAATRICAGSTIAVLRASNPPVSAGGSSCTTSISAGHENSVLFLGV